MSRIPPGKVLVKAGKFEGGKLPYVSYVGQIKPSDMPKIIWWGAYGNDTTGDGSISAPFLTFDRALEAFSTTQHKWILKTDLSVYGETGPGPYIDNPAGRVYLDPTRPDDSGDGLTPATAKKTYAAAKVALTSSGRSAIHCIGSFTLTDRIDARTQGEIGHTLTLNATPVFSLTETRSEPSREYYKVVRTASKALIVIGKRGASGTQILRSTDNGATWTEITNPWLTTRVAQGIAYGNGVLVVCGINVNVVLISTDDGLTWTTQSVGGVATNYSDVAFSGTHFILCRASATGASGDIKRSADAITWSNVSSAYTGTQNRIAANGTGGVMIVGGGPGGTAARMQYSADHGATFTNYSSLIGIGYNTGGAVCMGAEYNAGVWSIFQDTFSPAYYYTTNPAGTWSSVTGDLWFMHPNITPFVQVGYSALLGGYVYPESTSLAGQIRLVSTSFSTLLSSGHQYSNFATFCFENNGVQYALFLGATVSGTGKIQRMELVPANITAHATNIYVTGAAKTNYRNTRLSSSTLTRVSGFGTGIIERCRISSMDDIFMHRGAALSLRRSIIKGGADAAQFFGAAVNTGDIEVNQNTIIGKVQLNNTGGTDKELIRDNIIEGDFIAAAPVTVHSNIRGAVVNASGLSRISTINPIFKDTTDYELSRVALGQSVDSPLIKLSAFYSYTYNSQTYKDDLGAYRAFVALVKTSFKRAFLLPKFSGNALNEDVENVATLLKSINGVPDVSTRPDARLEIVSWTSKTIDSQVREFISYLERQKSTLVELYYDGDESVLSSIVVNGAHSSGTFEINITPKDVPVGTVLWLFGKLRYVVQRYPRAGDATKLILDEVLEGGLTNGQTIEIAQIQGGGEYVFVPEQRRQNQRVFSRKRDAYTGMKYTFVRKAL